MRRCAGHPPLDTHTHSSPPSQVRSLERWALEGLLAAFAPHSFAVADQEAASAPLVRMSLLDFVAYARLQAGAAPALCVGGGAGACGAVVGCPLEAGQRGGEEANGAEEGPGKGRWADGEPLVLFERELPSELLADVAVPDAFAQDLLAEAAEAVAAQRESRGEGCGGGDGGGTEAAPLEVGVDLLNEREWLVVSPRRSGTRWHTDPYETSAWNGIRSILPL